MTRGMYGKHRDCCLDCLGTKTPRHKALKAAQPGEGSWQLGTNNGAKVGTFKYTNFWGSFLVIFRHPLGDPLRVIVGGKLLGDDMHVGRTQNLDGSHYRHLPHERLQHDAQAPSNEQI